MREPAFTPDRRSILLSLSAAAGTLLLGGCGGGTPAGSTVAPTAGVPAGPAAAALPATDPQRLNLALNLSYAGAQFHALAATGSGLPAALLTGTGVAGTVTGGRAATLADPLVIAAAAGLAADKQAAVATLRAALGPAAAAMPAIDLSGPGGASFAQVLQAAGGANDPYATDTSYLLGSLALDYATPAILRGLLIRMTDPAASVTLQDVLVGAIHQNALVRALLAQAADADPAVATQASAVFASLAALDGAAPDDGMLADANTGSTDLFDAAGRPIPFTRAPAQALRFAFLNAGGAAGGFFPLGMNGVV